MLGSIGGTKNKVDNTIVLRPHLQRHIRGCDERGERKKHVAQEAGEPVCAEAVREVHREDDKSGQDGLEVTYFTLFTLRRH